MNQDWKAFIEAVPWFLPRGRDVEVADTHGVGAWHPITSDFERLFPNLHELLARARVTPVRVAADEYLLFTWVNGSGSQAWLARPPVVDVPHGLYSAHAILLHSFGGIVERHQRFKSWLMNHTEVLTLREASYDASFIRDYAWAFKRTGGKIPVEPTEFYSVAREANGNDTLCHRGTGKIILFAPDHAFSYVTPLEGCPEYTLYELHGAKHFVDWVNVIAAQWLEALGGAP